MGWLRLGELLLGQNLCSREKLKEAWDQKGLFGDRLGTNLLAIGALDEETLARTLGQQHQCNAAYGGLIRVDPAAVALLPERVADIGNCCPHHLDGNNLYVMMMNPTHRQTLEAVSRATRHKIIPVLVCEARMWDLLSTHYGISRGLRPIDLTTPKFVREAQAAASTPDMPVHSAELTSEEEFHAMYAGIHKSGPSTEVPGMESLEGQLPVLDDERRQADRRAMSDRTEPVETGAPRPVTMDHQPVVQGIVSEDPAVGFAPARSVEQLPHEPEAIHPGRTMGFDPPHTDLNAEAPLTLADAIESLRAATSRQELAEIVLRYALNDFKRVALLTVHPAGIAGWKAFGDEDFTSSKLSGYHANLSDRSVFTLVIQSRSHFIGPLETWKAHGEWVKATGRKIPKSVAVFPVLLHGQVINLLYGDNGHGAEVEVDDAANLMILMQTIGSSYEALLKNRDFG